MIKFNLQEKVRGMSYSVQIESLDGHVFKVVENGKKETVYPTREAFLEDFGELESWFWREDDE